MGWNGGLCCGLLSVTKLLSAVGFKGSPGQQEGVQWQKAGVWDDLALKGVCRQMVQHHKPFMLMVNYLSHRVWASEKWKCLPVYVWEVSFLNLQDRITSKKC